MDRIFMENITEVVVEQAEARGRPLSIKLGKNNVKIFEDVVFGGGLKEGHFRFGFQMILVKEGSLSLKNNIWNIIR